LWAAAADAGGVLFAAEPVWLMVAGMSLMSKA
jgi:hypothetical protein